MRHARKFRGIVVLADCDEAILESLRKALASTEYALLHARTGKEAMALLEQLKAKCDLAIIDLDLKTSPYSKSSDDLGSQDSAQNRRQHYPAP